MNVALQTERRVCDKHGEHDSRQLNAIIWTRCPACNAEEQAERAAAEAYKLQQIEFQRIGASEIPPRFRDRTLQSFVASTAAQRRAVDFSTIYTEQFDSVLSAGRSGIFVGRPGTGKTHLACAIALQVIHQGHTARYTTAVRATRRVKDSWGKDRSESEEQAIAALVSPDLLVVDEIGLATPSETDQRILFEVIDGRYQRVVPTLLISNHDVTEVKNAIGERAFDRMREGGGEVVVFDWQSHRGKP